MVLDSITKIYSKGGEKIMTVFNGISGALFLRKYLFKFLCVFYIIRRFKICDSRLKLRTGQLLLA